MVRSLWECKTIEGALFAKAPFWGKKGKAPIALTRALAPTGVIRERATMYSK
jgi:hypothetical protein